MMLVLPTPSSPITSTFEEEVLMKIPPRRHATAGGCPRRVPGSAAAMSAPTRSPAGRSRRAPGPPSRALPAAPRVLRRPSETFSETGRPSAALPHRLTGHRTRNRRRWQPAWGGERPGGTGLEEARAKAQLAAACAPRGPGQETRGTSSPRASPLRRSAARPPLVAAEVAERRRREVGRVKVRPPSQVVKALRAHGGARSGCPGGTPADAGLGIDLPTWLCPEGV